MCSKIGAACKDELPPFFADQPPLVSHVIISSTGAANAERTVTPAVKGMLTGMALRIPTIDVSEADLTVKFKKETIWQKSAQS